MANRLFASRLSRQNKKKVGMAIREMRERAGLRQQDLAELLWMPQSVISRVEAGNRKIDILELRDICSACGTTLSRFVQRLEAGLPT